MVLSSAIEKTDGGKGRVVEFAFTEEQEQLRKSVREFAEGEIAPHVMEWDEASHFPVEIIPKLAEMGLLGVIFPEEYGGAGLGYIEYALAIEELARVDGSVGLIVAAHNSLCSNHIFKFGTEAQKKKYLVHLASGKAIGAWSLTEPQAGSDAGGPRTTAVRNGKAWVLNGAKTFTTNGHYANYCVAMAVTDKSRGSHGISAFILVKGMPGVRAGHQRVSGRAIQAGGHGHAGGSGAIARVPSRVAGGQKRAAFYARSEHGKTVCERSCCEGGQRMRTDSRRVRLYQRLSCGEILSRREAVHDWRRHERDSAPGDCPAAPWQKISSEY